MQRPLFRFAALAAATITVLATSGCDRTIATSVAHAAAWAAEDAIVRSQPLVAKAMVAAAASAAKRKSGRCI